VGAVAVHLVIGLRARLETAIDDVHAQAEELRTQGEELAQQNEELAGQAEELSRQGEELGSQNEELQSQAEEIGALNEALQQREGLLEGLLDMARLAPTEGVALEHIARAALDLFGGSVAAVAVYERVGVGLAQRAFAASMPEAVDPSALPAEALVTLAAEQNRTAALDDLSLRPDLMPAGVDVIRAVLAAPIRLGDRAPGALVVYAAGARTWVEEEFRLAEWLADQCGRVLLALRLQAELRDADRRKGEFLATLSHELRNPLAPMRYALHLLEAGRDNDTTALPILQRQFKQLVRLVDDLLDATRLSSNKIQVRKSRTDLCAIVRQAVDGCRPDIAAARHTLALELPHDAVWVDGDSERLAQVAANLINNAIRYTPAGGHIGIALTTSPSEVVFTVCDDGVGLNAGDLGRVFDMFTQVGAPGSGGLGIGLALVRGIVELHGGHVEALSEGAGRGSRFRVTLPAASQQALDGVRRAATSPGGGTPRRVLVVDDNQDAAEMMGALLRRHGHQVRIAHDAGGALAAQADFAADVALLDIGLPGVDGYDLARQLRAATSHPLRLIAVTGWGQEGDRARARAAGFDAHLTKPAEIDAVLATLRVVDEPGVASE
jgi:signal transduction histidine kinase